MVTQIMQPPLQTIQALAFVLSSTRTNRSAGFDPHDTFVLQTLAGLKRSRRQCRPPVLRKNITKVRLTDLLACLQVNPKDISIDADLEELSAVVTYVVETTYLDASGAAIDSEKVKIQEGLV